jgi:hypothetical protein
MLIYKLFLFSVRKELIREVMSCIFKHPEDSINETKYIVYKPEYMAVTFLEMPSFPCCDEAPV